MQQKTVPERPLFGGGKRFNALATPDVTKDCAKWARRGSGNRTSPIPC